MISQAPEPLSVERHGSIRGDERGSPAGDPAPAPAPLLLTAGQAIQKTAGVKQRDSVVTDEAGLEQRELPL